MPKNRISFTNDFVLNNNRIGVGTTNPVASVDVVGDIRLSSIGSTVGQAIKLEHYNTNNGSFVVETNDKHLFSVTNDPDPYSPNLIYVINDDNASNALSVSNTGLTTIRTLSISTSITTPIVNFLAAGVASTSVITARHYGNNNGSLVFESGDKQLFSITNQAEGLIYSITDDNANPVLSISTALNTNLVGKFIIASKVGASSTEKVELQAHGVNNGTLSVNNTGGNQLFTVTNTLDAGSEFKINQYNSSGIVSQNTATRTVLSVSFGGTLTTLDPINVGTALTNNFPPDKKNIIRGPLQLRAPFSTEAQIVNIVPKYFDRGALSFEAPVGTAQTDRGTQIFSISNNLSQTIFRVNDVNRNTILEATATGNIGIGTTLPQTKLQVNGLTRISSVGSTSAEQIDIRHYRDISPQQVIGLNTNNRGAISFDSATGISSNGIALFPASLFAITNDPTGNIFSVGGYRYFSGSAYPAIDVTQNGRVGIGTTVPLVDFHINSATYTTGIITTNSNIDVVTQDLNKISFASSVSTISANKIYLSAINPGVYTTAPSRRATIFEGDYQSITSGGQLLSITNDNTSLFTVNRFVGLSSTRLAPTGQLNIDPVIDIKQSSFIGINTDNPIQPIQIGSATSNVVVIDSIGELGIGTTNPSQKLHVIGNSIITGVSTVGLASTSSPSNNSSFSFELTNNTTLTVRVRGTDGVIRTGTITLS